LTNHGTDSLSLLKEAEEHEKRSEWREAANCYDRFLREKSLLLQESLDLALRSASDSTLAAWQADDVNSFKAEIEAARSTYLRLEQELDKNSSSLSLL